MKAGADPEESRSIPGGIPEESRSIPGGKIFYLSRKLSL